MERSRAAGLRGDADLDSQWDDSPVHEALAWARREHPDLSEELDLCQDLVAIQHRAKAHISPDIDVHEQAIGRRLLDGQPQLNYARLGVEPTAFAHLVGDILATLIRYRKGQVQANGAHGMPPAEHLTKLARQAFLRKTRLTDLELAVLDPVTLAVEIALVPYLERAAEVLMPHLDQYLWQRGYCPLCGAIPDLALLAEESGVRYLVCFRCNSQWRHRSHKCPFCGVTDSTQQRCYPSDKKAYQVCACELCKHCLKTIDPREVQGELFLPVERVVMARLDAVAREKGYAV